MKIVFTALLIVIAFTAYPQTDSTKQPVDTSTNSSQADGTSGEGEPGKKDSTATAELQNKEIFSDLVVYLDVPFEINILEDRDKHLHIRMIKTSIDEADADGQSTNSKTSNLSVTSEMGYNQFLSVVYSLLKQLDSGYDIATLRADPNLILQLNNVYDKIKRQLIISYSKEGKELASRLEQYETLDEQYRYAGALKIKQTIVPTWKHKQAIGKDTTRTKLQSVRDRIMKTASQYLNSSFKIIRDSLAEIDEHYDTTQLTKDAESIFRKNFQGRRKRKIPDERTDGEFRLDSSYFSFFNNSIDKMIIWGVYRRSPNAPWKSTQNHFVQIRGLNSSMALRDLNYKYAKNIRFIINSGSENDYYVNLSDLFEYSPYKNNYPYIVKDNAYTLKSNSADTVAILERRGLFNYLSIITFIDFLGLNSNTNNNFIQIEGRARFPLHLSSFNWPPIGNMILFPNLEAQLNASFVNGSSVGGRRTEVFENAAKDSLFFDNFDLVRNYNILSNIGLGVFALRYNQIHSRIYFNYNLKMLRTPFNYTKFNEGEDSSYNTNIFSVAHGPSVSFEYRPDFNIGFDLRLSVDYNLSQVNFRNNELKYNGTYGAIYTNQPHSFTPISTKQKRVYGLEFNAYSFLTPNKEKNDGIYVRLAAFTDYKFKQISPYILAGYATSLKGLVKKNTGSNPEVNPPPNN